MQFIGPIKRFSIDYTKAPKSEALEDLRNFAIDNYSIDIHPTRLNSIRLKIEHSTSKYDVRIRVFFIKNLASVQSQTLILKPNQIDEDFDFTEDREFWGKMPFVVDKIAFAPVKGTFENKSDYILKVKIFQKQEKLFNW